MRTPACARLRLLIAGEITQSPWRLGGIDGLGVVNFSQQALATLDLILIFNFVHYLDKLIATVIAYLVAMAHKLKLSFGLERLQVLVLIK